MKNLLTQGKFEEENRRLMTEALKRRVSLARHEM